MSYKANARSLFITEVLPPRHVSFVPEADKADKVDITIPINVEQASQLVGDGSELSKVVARYHLHRRFLSLRTLSYSCFK
ncbi:Uncharacterised protein [Yersinia frederiksenii]|nr:Uncharacterised protein [Yersinia frederiksenii]